MLDALILFTPATIASANQPPRPAPSSATTVRELVYDTFSAPRAGAAFNELCERLDQPKLDPAVIRAIAERGLAIQSSRPPGWTETFGDFIEEAQHSGQLPRDLWEGYVCNLVRSCLKLTMPPRIMRGQRLQLQIDQLKMKNVSATPTHLGGGGQYRISIDGHIVHLEEVDFNMGGPDRIYIDLNAPQVPWSITSWKGVATDSGPFARLTDGPHKFKIALAVNIEDHLDTALRNSEPVTVIVTLDATVDFVSRH